jgi:hypothetical protein
MRIAVLGLYNSGSSALAGMLHRLGVNMAPPFFEDFYEPYELAWHLRNWWDEPRLTECAPPAHRVSFLRQWVELQERGGHRAVGAKHPLLSLCGPDLVAAWGEEVRFIWSYRSLDDSIEGLKRRQWFMGHEEHAQRRLWDALQAFERSDVPIFKLDWREVKANPARAARELARIAEIEATAAQMNSAASIVRPTDGAPRRATAFGRRLYSTLRGKFSSTRNSDVPTEDLAPLTDVRPPRWR